jgi:ABC-type multidrug transport system fused ATPase/permease subunit
LSQRGDIELRNLQLRYRSDLPLVLKGVSCRIQAQEKIGICGRQDRSRTMGAAQTSGPKRVESSSSKEKIV